MFPLGTVLFPHMVLPLHVFEPRYRAMMHDVLDGDREFGVVLITRGHEVGGGDARSGIGTVARVVDAEELDDGRWVVVGVGTRRIDVVRWLDDDPYPRAEVADRAEAPPAGSRQEVVARLAEIVPRLRRVLAMRLDLGSGGVAPTFDLDPDPTVACWQLAAFSPITAFDAQRVLETDAGDARLDCLATLLDEVAEALDFRLHGHRHDGV